MIGVLAAIKNPSAFERLILVGPSPCYINDEEYAGGFNRSDIDSLLQTRRFETPRSRIRRRRIALELKTRGPGFAPSLF
jgi:hypothetical protein